MLSKRGKKCSKKRPCFLMYGGTWTFSYYIGNHQTSMMSPYFTILLPFLLIWSPLVLALMRCPRAL